MENKGIEHIWSILCTNSTVDQQTNNISLFNVVEEITFTITGPVKDGPIGVPFSCDLVTLWKKNDERDQIQADGLIELIDPSGEKIEEKSYLINIKREHKRLRSILKIQGLKITKPGLYTFKVKYKLDKKDGFIEAGKIVVLVNLIKKTQIQGRA